MGLLNNENSISGGGYTIKKSLRFRSSASAYLNRTPASAGNRKTWTWSGWVKRGKLNIIQGIFGAGSYSNGTQGFQIAFQSDNTLRVFEAIWGSATVFLGDSVAVYRDPSSWYHIVVSIDTTQATSTNRLKVYVNNSQITLTNYSAPSLNTDYSVNGTSEHTFGKAPNGAGGSSIYIDGYLAEVNFIDGQALTPSSFGSIDTLTNTWTAKKYTGTYGTNGFYLPFTDTSSTTNLVTDSSGNGNNWTPNNISLTAGVTYDSMIDSPTNGSSGTRSVGNYAVISPIDTTGSNTITEGNLKVTTAGSSINCRSTFNIPTTGKWYFEATDIVSGGNNVVGIANRNLPISTSPMQSQTGSISVFMADNAVFGFAFDFDALTYTIYKNNIVNSSGSITSGIEYAVFIGTSSSGGASTAFNFGQRPFAYTPPTGFKSLNTANLPEPTIKKSSEYMDVTTWTGTGATRSITGVGFQPDLVWSKSRSNAETHKLVDSVRGATKALSSETTGDEVTESGITSFNSDGFTIDGATDTGYNTNTYTYVGWTWKKGTTPGFDIVTYTGNGSARTISHGLGVAPRMIIAKARTTASTDQGWPVYHANNTAAPETDYLLMNSTAATADLDTIWNDTAPTSSVFSVGTNALVNTNNDAYVAYLFAEVPGFSKFGGYTGNGSADGPFIFCGFRPRWVMLKRTNAAEEWSLYDSVRDVNNGVRRLLQPNVSDAENTYGTDRMDFTSNGFKLRTTGTAINASGGTYIFAAFAENPFKYSLAR